MGGIIPGTLKVNGKVIPISAPVSGVRYSYNPVGDDHDGKKEYAIKFRKNDILPEILASKGQIIITGSTEDFDFWGSADFQHAANFLDSLKVLLYNFIY